MERYGSELYFIQRITPDGRGTSELGELGHLKDEEFILTPLSITEGTYIASGFNTFTVKLKNPPKYYGKR